MQDVWNEPAIVASSPSRPNHNGCWYWHIWPESEPGEPCQRSPLCERVCTIHPVSTWAMLLKCINVCAIYVYLLCFPPFPSLPSSLLNPICPSSLSPPLLSALRCLQPDRPHCLSHCWYRQPHYRWLLLDPLWPGRQSQEQSPQCNRLGLPCLPPCNCQQQSSGCKHGTGECISAAGWLHSNAKCCKWC